MNPNASNLCSKIIFSGRSVAKSTIEGAKRPAGELVEFLERCAARDRLGQALGEFIEFVVHTLPLFGCFLVSRAADKSAFESVGVGIGRTDFCEFNLQPRSFVRASATEFDRARADQSHGGSEGISFKDDRPAAVDGRRDCHQGPKWPTERPVQVAAKIRADFALD